MTSDERQQLHEQVLSCIIAFLLALLTGATIHYLSRWLGLAETTPGVILGTAFMAVVLTNIHWRFR